MFNKSSKSYLHIVQTVLFQLLNVGFIFILAAKLSVEEMAVYGVAKSLLAFIEYSHLGTRFGLDIILPLSTYERSFRYTTGVLNITFFINVLLCLFFGLYYSNIFIILFLISSPFYNIYNINRLSNRAIGNTPLFIKQSILLNYVPVLLQILSLLIIGFNGISIALIISYSALLFFSKKETNFICFRKINFSDILYLHKKGMPFLVSNLSFIAVTVLDRIFIERYAGDTIAGYYTFVFIFLSFLLVIPNAITELMMSKVFEAIGNKKILYNLFKQSFLVIFFIGIISCLFVFFITDFIVELFFVKYVAITSTLKLGLLYVVPASLISVFQYILIANKKKKNIIIINIITFLFFYILLFILFKFSVNFSLEEFIWLRIIHIWLFLIFLAWFLYKSLYKYEYST